jgi:hypothetical protein
MVRFLNAPKGQEGPEGRGVGVSSPLGRIGFPAREPGFPAT